MIALVHTKIDVDAVRRSVDDPRFGAILLFEGVARQDFDGREVVELAYEAYAELAVPVMQEIAQEVAHKWPGARASIVHRTGVVAIEEPSVVIAVGTPHRAACYEASRYCIDELKTRVPVWKKELYRDGSEWKANATPQRNH